MASWCACARIGLLVMFLTVAALCLTHVAGEPGFNNGSLLIRSSPADTVSVRAVALNVETMHQQEQAKNTIVADQELAGTSIAAAQELMERTSSADQEVERTAAADKGVELWSAADQELMKRTSAADDEVESTTFADQEAGSSWTEGSGFPGGFRRVGMEMIVQRRGLRTSTRCNLPAGACQGTLRSTCCGRTCADVLTNRNHCGRCGHVCRASRECCNGKCRRLATDERNCGRCGTRCALGTRCLFGLCGY